MATADLRPLPDIMIVGTQRAGTTSLRRWLREHPAATYEAGEVHFFDHNYGVGPALVPRAISDLPSTWAAHRVFALSALSSPRSGSGRRHAARAHPLRRAAPRAGRPGHVALPPGALASAANPSPSPMLWPQRTSDWPERPRRCSGVNGAGRTSGSPTAPAAATPNRWRAGGTPWGPNGSRSSRANASTSTRPSGLICSSGWVFRPRPSRSPTSTPPRIVEFEDTEALGDLRDQFEPDNEALFDLLGRRFWGR